MVDGKITQADVDKAREALEKARDARDKALEKARDARDKALEKAREAWALDKKFREQK